MSEAAALPAPAAAAGGRFLTVRIGWRNLWRNRRRSYLTSGGIAFSVLLVMFFMAMQYGQYEIMIDTATSLLDGHVQVRAKAYVEDERFEDTIVEASALRRQLESAPGVAAVAPRVEAYALVSADDRSFGAQVLGVDIEAEVNTVRFTRMLNTGRQLESAGEAVLGTTLARNLGVGVGDEVVVLGAGKEGGVAAMALNVVGLLETGMADLDRVLLLSDLPGVQLAFDLGDEVHTFALRLHDIDLSPAVVAQLRASLPELLEVRPWQEVLPELEQAIAVDKVGGEIMYWIIMVLVMFSVVNSFIMTVFERTREFGMLLAIGMRPTAILVMLQWEAFFLWLIGAAVGTALACGLIFWLSATGIYLGEQMQDYAQQFYMPARLYPGFSLEVLTLAPLAMLLGAQLAALLPSLRIRRLRPVDALRTA